MGKFGLHITYAHHYNKKKSKNEVLCKRVCVYNIKWNGSLSLIYCK